jgi:hypothetical protein
MIRKKCTSFEREKFMHNKWLYIGFIPFQIMVAVGAVLLIADISVWGQPLLALGMLGAIFTSLGMDMLDRLEEKKRKK